jgi:hypothetical protein
MSSDQKYTVTLEPVLVPVHGLESEILKKQLTAFVDEILEHYYATQRLPEPDRRLLERP